MSPDDVGVLLLNGYGTKYFKIGDEVTAENVCFECARACEIGPVARHLFALRRPDKSWVIPACRLINEGFKETYEFRLRFHLPDVGQLQLVDTNAMNYSFYQIRQDFLNGCIPEALNSQEKILGLAVTDMYRVSLERNITRENIERDYKKYLPNNILKNVIFLHLGVKKAMHTALINLERRITDTAFLKVQYVNQLNELAPHYSYEEYDVQIDSEGAAKEMKITFEPLNKEKSGLWIHTKSKKKVQSTHVCSIDELCFISVRLDNTVEISRKNGVPQYFKFDSPLKMQSFIGVLDGYYRLMEKWTFNLCKEFPTPFLQTLRLMKCHGPVGRSFAYHKLAAKRKNAAGCYILRQGSHYDTYRLDVCSDDRENPETLAIVQTKEGYKFEDRLRESFSTISELLSFYNEQLGGCALKECIPPSEYDDSPLLLCKIRGNDFGEFSGNGSANSDNDLHVPQCIDTRQIKLESIVNTSGRFTAVLKGVWNRGNGKQINVALKTFKKLKNDLGKIEEFMQMANNCLFWHCESIVTFHGVTLSNPLSLVMEYLPLGPLNVYLQQNYYNIKEVDLVEAAVYLGKALWYLEEHGIVHGNICCKNLLVALHEDNVSFKIKLADPGLGAQQREYRIHWIPPECYDNPALIVSQFTADVWAFGTTLWEIFSMGQIPLADATSIKEVKEFYKGGGHLPFPENYHPDVYKLMCECWCKDPDTRKKPQAIVRDINQILYEVHNSRRRPEYAVLGPNQNVNSDSQNYPRVQPPLPYNSSSLRKRDSIKKLPEANIAPPESLEDQIKNFWREANSVPNSPFRMSPSNTSLDSMVQEQEAVWVIEMSELEVKNRIGQGFYGEVSRAFLTRYSGLKKEEVAVKELKNTCELVGHQDLLREITIMKGLQHKNIVEIKGVVEDPKTLLVMEYVPLGSMLVYIKTHKQRLSEKLLLKFSLDIAEGMEYLNQKHVVHRDLAARNILVASEDTVKISDFGLAQKTGDKNYYKLKTNRDLPVRWYAPETLSMWKFTSKSDVWSFGVTLWEMFSYGREPIMDGCKDDELLKALDEGKRLGFPNTCSLRIYTDLMKLCWEKEPSMRPSFTQLLTEIKRLYEDV